MGLLKFDRDKHKYYDGDRELVSVTRLLAATNLAKDLAFLELDPIYLERGTLIHEMFGLIDRGEYDDTDTTDSLKPYARGIEAFKRDTGFQGHVWELSLAMPEVGVAGTLDCVGEFPRPRGAEPCLIDVKTGVLQTLGVSCQLAAYSDLATFGQVIGEQDFDSVWFANAVSLNIERKSLNLKGDGTYTLRNHDEQIWRKRWRAAVEMYNTWKEYGLLKERTI